MKRILLFILLVFAAFAIGATGAMASTINFDGTHNFYLTVQKPDLTYLSPQNGTGNIQTGANDWADFSPSEGGAQGVGPTTIANINNTYTVQTTLAAGTWLTGRNDSVYYAGNSLGIGKFGGTISRDFTALGPDPVSAGGHGSVGQYNEKFAPNARTQLLHLVYSVPTTGTYKVNFSDTYFSTASVDQSTGSAYDVNWFHGYAIMGVRILAGSNFSDNGQLLYDKTYGTPGSYASIANFSDVTSSSFTLGSFDYGMTAGQTISLDVYLTANYEAQTYKLPDVPVPPAVLLLGTGLIGLIGIRRKFRK